MKRKTFLFFIILLGIQSTTIANEIIVTEGDTLAKIAENYNITIRSIMDTNKLYDGDNLKAGDKLILPANAIIKKEEISSIKHTVIKGDTLDKISNKYSIDKMKIINLNKLKDPNILQLNQILLLPKEAKMPLKNYQYHTLSEGETIYQISKKYDISIKEIVSLNNIIETSNLMTGTRIKLFEVEDLEIKKNNDRIGSNSKQKDKSLMKENNKFTGGDDWRYYGPLKINWSSWRTVNGSYVAPAKHSNGRSLFLAINCKSSKITSSKSNGKWKKWVTPKTYFEYNLLDERCENAS